MAVQVDGVEVQVALQWCSDAFSDSLLGFVNSIKTVDGGTHMDGFKAALTRTVNSQGRKSKTLKEGDANLSGDHIREGLSAIVSVKASCLRMPSCPSCFWWQCSSIHVMMHTCIYWSIPDL